jgi:hypothetical protein
LRWTVGTYFVSKNHIQYKTKLLVYQKTKKFSHREKQEICAAAVVTNNHVDTLLIKQISNEYMVVLEVIIGNIKIIVASMYFHINREIEIDLVKIEGNIITCKGSRYSHSSR